MVDTALQAPTSKGFAQGRDGHALERLVDDIEALNKREDSLTKLRQEGAESGLTTAAKADGEKDKSQFRQYDSAPDRVKAFYLEQHTKQTVAYNLKARNHLQSQIRPEMSVWDAMEKLNSLTDDSDPDTELSQIEHLLQSAEAIRRDGKPRWMQLTGLIHDLGKLLFFFTDTPGQWAVVGDTFPVGCRYSEHCVYGTESFSGNPDYSNEIYSTECGIYAPGTGLDNVMLAWGHDEYLYHVIKDQSYLPDEALAMIRYHSFYPWHQKNAYHWLMSPKDHKMLEAVREFNPYDLYSKSDDKPRIDELKPYYLDLIDEFFPTGIIRW